MMYSRRFNVLMWFALVGVVLAAFGALIIKSHYEAETYNRLTGGTATTWDALWVQLRVMGKE